MTAVWLESHAGHELHTMSYTANRHMTTPVVTGCCALTRVLGMKPSGCEPACSLRPFSDASDLCLLAPQHAIMNIFCRNTQSFTLRNAMCRLSRTFHTGQSLPGRNAHSP